MKDSMMSDSYSDNKLRSQTQMDSQMTNLSTTGSMSSIDEDAPRRRLNATTPKGDIQRGFRRDSKSVVNFQVPAQQTPLSITIHHPQDNHHPDLVTGVSLEKELPMHIFLLKLNPNHDIGELRLQSQQPDVKTTDIVRNIVHLSELVTKEPKNVSNLSFKREVESAVMLEAKSTLIMTEEPENHHVPQELASLPITDFGTIISNENSLPQNNLSPTVQLLPKLGTDNEPLQSIVSFSDLQTKELKNISNLTFTQEVGSTLMLSTNSALIVIEESENHHIPLEVTPLSNTDFNVILSNENILNQDHLSPTLQRVPKLESNDHAETFDHVITELGSNAQNNVHSLIKYNESEETRIEVKVLNQCSFESKVEYHQENSIPQLIETTSLENAGVLLHGFPDESKLESNPKLNTHSNINSLSVEGHQVEQPHASKDHLMNVMKKGRFKEKHELPTPKESDSPLEENTFGSSIEHPEEVSIPQSVTQISTENTKPLIIMHQADSITDPRPTLNCQQNIANDQQILHQNPAIAELGTFLKRGRFAEEYELPTPIESGSPLGELSFGSRIDHPEETLIPKPLDPISMEKMTQISLRPSSDLSCHTDLTPIPSTNVNMPVSENLSLMRQQNLASSQTSLKIAPCREKEEASSSELKRDESKIHAVREEAVENLKQSLQETCETQILISKPQVHEPSVVDAQLSDDHSPEGGSGSRKSSLSPDGIIIRGFVFSVEI